MRENSKLRTAVLETLWKSTLVGLAVFDGAQGTLREANGAFLDLLDSRYRTKKTLGSSLEQCLPEVEASGLQAAFRQCLSSGLAVHADAVRFHHNGGASLLVNCILMPLLEEHGEGSQGEAGLTPVLLVASERKTELPASDRLNLVDIHTRQALARHFHLSAREIDIVGECLQGKKNRQIAQDLHIGISTVKRHLESAYRKMGISSSRSLPIAILNVLRSLDPVVAAAGVNAEYSLAAAPQAGSQAA
ncbi:MAG TPA: LuxR C-terminal-related transcriptional regulator [Terriglobales bacterium]|nr:LuxR C-terminal-related transcriptional regulator [Terriglobales bacterium]